MALRAAAVILVRLHVILGLERGRRLSSLQESPSMHGILGGVHSVEAKRLARQAVNSTAPYSSMAATAYRDGGKDHGE